MACNWPIVATDVCDIKQVIGRTIGCYTCSFEEIDIARKIDLAFNFNNKTKGRENIKHLDELIIAKRIVEIYESAKK